MDFDDAVIAKCDHFFLTQNALHAYYHYTVYQLLMNSDTPNYTHKCNQIVTFTTLFICFFLPTNIKYKNSDKFCFYSC